MNRDKKSELIKLAENILSNHQISILINYKGVKAGDFSSLRMQLKEKNGGIKIIKNNLVLKATENIKNNSLDNYLSNQIAISYCDDPIDLANILVNFSKENENIKILVGLLNGNVVDFNYLESLSKLGSLSEVRANFIGMLQAPASSLVGVLDAFLKKETLN